MDNQTDNETGKPQAIAVVLATGNRDKVRELQPLLAGISPSIDLHSLADLGLSPDIDETEPTLEGNARLKAAELFSLVESRFDWLIVLADDTGLEVDALGGAPGVRSARYAPTPEGRAPTYDENVSHLLRSMDGCSDRSARFRTVIALRGRVPGQAGEAVQIDETVEGTAPGTITRERHGSGGFGYDPVFRPGNDGRTFAEMTLEEKNAISHRSRAVTAAAARIASLIPGSGPSSAITTDSTP